MAVHNQAKMLLKGVLDGIRPVPVSVNPGEVYHLHKQAQVVRVLSGSAWITFDMKDIVLRKGRNVYLPASEFPTLLSAVGQSPVVFEIQLQ
jgi:quercetin dioxygenase-like cupin family protein